MRNPQPFTVYQPIPRPDLPEAAFHRLRLSIEQARALVASRVAGETIVLPVASVTPRSLHAWSYKLADAA